MCCTMCSWNCRVYALCHGLTLDHVLHTQDDVLAWTLIHCSIVWCIDATVLLVGLRILVCVRVGRIGIRLDDSIDHFWTVLRSHIIDLMLPVFLVLLNLSLNEALILGETLSNLFTATERNILIWTPWRDVFISASKTIITPITVHFLWFDLDQVNL